MPKLLLGSHVEIMNRYAALLYYTGRASFGEMRPRVKKGPNRAIFGTIWSPPQNDTDAGGHDLGPRVERYAQE